MHLRCVWHASGRCKSSQHDDDTDRNETGRAWIPLDTEDVAVAQLGVCAQMALRLPTGNAPIRAGTLPPADSGRPASPWCRTSHRPSDSWPALAASRPPQNRRSATTMVGTPNTWALIAASVLARSAALTPCEPINPTTSWTSRLVTSASKVAGSSGSRPVVNSALNTASITARVEPRPTISRKYLSGLKGCADGIIKGMSSRSASQVHCS